MTECEQRYTILNMISAHEIYETDVLVIGAGLAGFRAGISVRENYKNNRVTLVSEKSGPAGSSFTNINNSLGIVVCRTDDEKQAFIEKAESISQPGTISKKMVHILAEDSEARYFDLLNLKFKFNRDQAGKIIRHPACFFNEIKMAHIFCDLKDCFIKMKKKYLSLGGGILGGWILQNFILNDESGISGAIFKSISNRYLVVRTKSIILATGGFTPLFRRNIGGSGHSFYNHALLKRAGIDFVNMPYIQFLWYETGRRRFFPLSHEELKRIQIETSEHNFIRIPKNMIHFALSRINHAPVAYCLEDSEIDMFLLNYSTSDGQVKIRFADKRKGTIALYAHASNGGVKIDENGFTGVSGLFACGELAGGMHGANRIGGAMVLSTQVFGERAGRAAGKFSENISHEDVKKIRDISSAFISSIILNDFEWEDGLGFIKNNMPDYKNLSGMVSNSALVGKFQNKLKASTDYRLQLALETAILTMKRN